MPYIVQVEPPTLTAACARRVSATPDIRVSRFSPRRGQVSDVGPCQLHAFDTCPQQRPARPSTAA